MTVSPTRHRAVFCGLRWPMWPGRSGGEIRDFQLVRELIAQRFDLDFFSLWDVPPEGQADPLRERLAGWHVPSPIDIADTRPGFWFRVLLKAQLNKWPVRGQPWHGDVMAHLWRANALREQLRETLADAQSDFLIVSPQLNPVALGGLTKKPSVRTILASYDVESVRMERLAASATGFKRVALRIEVRRAARFERSNLAQFDGVIAVSALDASVYRERFGIPRERIVVIENGVDPDYIRSRRQPTSPPLISLIGAMSYPPNEQAAWRLIRGIVPRVRARAPTRLAVVGQGASPALLRAQNGTDTIVSGAVDDVRPYLEQSAVVCVPLLAGSGTKIKILEAMCAGVPVVCSSVAAEGLAVVHEEHVLIAETDEGFAAAVCRILEDERLALRLSTNARRLIEARYEWSRCLSPLRPWLDNIRELPPLR